MQDTEGQNEAVVILCLTHTVLNNLAGGSLSQCESTSAPAAAPLSIGSSFDFSDAGSPYTIKVRQELA